MHKQIIFYLITNLNKYDKRFLAHFKIDETN